MKKNLFAICATVTASLLTSPILMAQNSSPYWSLAGNSNAASTSKLGTTNNISLRFYSNNVQRMIINSAAGLVGIGTTSPTDKLHINSPSGTSPLRVQVNGSTKLRVSSGGGVSIGSSTTPPSNGLYVAGKVGIGTATPNYRLQVVAGFDGDGILAVGSSSGPKDAAFILSDNLGHYGSLGLASANDAFMAGVVSGDIVLSNSGGKIHVGTGEASSFPTMTVDGGNVGISTTSTVADFHVVHDLGSLDNGLRLQNEASNNFWNFYTRSLGDLELSVNGGVTRGLFSFTSGAYTSFSDRRMKKDIEKSSDVLSKVLQLEVIKYHALQNKPDDQKYYGLIAQDVEKLFPEVVYHTTSDGSSGDVYTMDYSAFGVIAIKAIQELQPLVEEQKEKIATLEDRIIKLEAALATITANNNGNVSNEIANGSLEQNKPNPFNKNTIIRYNIPQGSKGQINIYDQAGKLVKMLNANAGGQSEVSGHDLAAGTYTYTLMVNDKAALSKQMLIIK